MKITVGQFNVKSKDIKYNYKQMKTLINEAIAKNFDMIVFGEYVLSGYACGSLFKNPDFISELESYQKKLKQFSQKISLVFGGILYKDENLFKAAIIYSDHKTYYSLKENLNKREFNEKDYFVSGKNQVIKILDREFLISFKDDLFLSKDFNNQTLIVLDSSPVNQFLKTNLNNNLVYSNTLGVSAVDKVVWINGGNSYIKLNSDVYTFNNPLDVGIITKKGQTKNISKLFGLSHGIKIWSNQTFGLNKKWIIGNSGGLDSAVTTALLSIALGSENVLSYNMASKYNKQLTINNARILAKKLNVVHYQNNIEALIQATNDSLYEFGYQEILEFDQENIQARTRGHLLAAFAALENGVVCNNSNKLELSLGYATMYGDTIGALSVIGDLTKVEVFELAEEINDYFNEEIISHNLLPQVKDYKIHWEFAPSAELKNDQVDPMKWFYHDKLLELLLSKTPETILQNYLDHQFKNWKLYQWLDFYELLAGEKFLEDFNWFYQTMQINHFKRLQAPPVLAYGSSVLSFDFKESANLLPKSKKYKELEQAILNKY